MLTVIDAHADLEFQKLCVRLPKREWQTGDFRIAKCYIDKPDYADARVEMLTVVDKGWGGFSEEMMGHPYVWLPRLDQLLDLAEEKYPGKHYLFGVNVKESVWDNEKRKFLEGTKWRYRFEVGYYDWEWYSEYDKFGNTREMSVLKIVVDEKEVEGEDELND